MEGERLVIETVDQLLQKTWALEDEGWIFRGHADALWTLRAAVHRKRRLPAQHGNVGEKQLLHEFKRRATAMLTRPPGNDLEWLFLAQHHGLPTRLLDWTTNPLVALFFAVRREDSDRDGAVIAYRHGHSILDFESIPDPFQIERTELCYPPHLSPRIAAQSGLFTIEPCEVRRSTISDDSRVITWPVSCDRKREIRKQLTKVGISEGTMFPDLDGICADIVANHVRS